MRRLVFAVLLLLAAPSARADDAALQNIYAGLEPSARNEYTRLLAPIENGERGDTSRSMLKAMIYNRAALIAVCAADAQEGRPPNARPLPSAANIMLTTCIDERVGELNRFTNILGYANTFFPERVKRCGEVARLRQREAMLPPYAFLEIKEPKLYDFPRYSTCLMTRAPDAAR